jgi:hypothetical protein
LSREEAIGQCVYCGKSDTITMDHIPPKCLFSKPRPSDLITVPSCKRHNLGRSKDDEYLRLVLAHRLDTLAHPDVEGILPSIKRSFEREENKAFVNNYMKDVRKVDFWAEDGEYIGKGLGYLADVSRVNGIARQIVKGLYYHEMDDILSPNMEVVVCWDEGLRQVDSQLIKGLEIAQQNPKRTIGRGAFSYQYAFVQDSDEESLWVMEFYEKIRFFATIVPVEIARTFLAENLARRHIGLS